mgnify:CR=1 FL=1
MLHAALRMRLLRFGSQQKFLPTTSYLIASWRWRACARGAALPQMEAYVVNYEHGVNTLHQWRHGLGAAWRRWSQSLSSALTTAPEAYHPQPHALHVILPLCSAFHQCCGLQWDGRDQQRSQVACAKTQAAQRL